MRKALAAVLLALLLLTACGSPFATPTPYPGYTWHVWYTSNHDDGWVTEYNCLPGSGIDMSGGTQTCSLKMVYHPETHTEHRELIPITPIPLVP